MRRGQPQRRVAAARPAGTPPAPARPAPTERAPVAPATPAAGDQRHVPSWVHVIEWGAWILLWISAVGAGYFLGKIDIAKALFIAIMLAITVLPWLRWVRRGSSLRLAPSRIAMVHGVLAIFVGLVLALSGTYWWALPLVVVQLALAMVILVKADRPVPQQT